MGEGGYGNFGFADQGIEFSTNSYRYVHLWVKPLTPGSWLSFHCWDVTQSTWRDLNGDRDGDKLFESGEDLVAGQWNEVWVDLLQNSQGFAGGTVRSFHLHSSGNSQFLVDGIYTVSQPWQTFWYHCDYLGSPRVMTDASGAVVWRQDYYAFGSDAGAAATGNTHKFTGHTQDAATGQYYAKARYFTTQLGRWSQPEPLLKGVPGSNFLSNPQKLNPYTYCINNPLKFTDPTGNHPEWPSYIPIFGFGYTLAEGAYHALGGTDNESFDAGAWSERMVSSTLVSAITIGSLSLGGLTGAEEIGRRSTQSSSGYIAAMEHSATGSVEMPKGQISAKTMGEISAKTGNEVGLFRTDYGARVLKMGTETKTTLPTGTTKIIAHTHPSGVMSYSLDDLYQLQALKQRSSVLINLEGEATRLPVK